MLSDSACAKMKHIPCSSNWLNAISKTLSEDVQQEAVKQSRLTEERSEAEWDAFDAGVKTPKSVQRLKAWAKVHIIELYVGVLLFLKCVSGRGFSKCTAASTNTL